MENSEIVVVVVAKCHACGWEIKYSKNVNEHGFYEFGEAYCPKCFTLLNTTGTKEDNPDWGERFGGEKKKD